MSARLLLTALLMLAPILVACRPVVTTPPEPTATRAATSKAEQPSTAPLPDPTATPPEPTATPTATNGEEHPSPLLIAQIPIVVSFPTDYRLRDNTHPTIPNYRGKIVAFYFVPPSMMAPAMLQDMSFSSEASIRAFQEDCPLSQAECDYHAPDLDEFLRQKAAFEAGADYGDFQFMQIGEHQYLVAQIPPQGEQPHARDYITFLGDIRVYIWVWMIDADQAEAADALVAGITFSAPEY